MNEATELKEKRTFIQKRRRNDALAAHRIDVATVALGQATAYISQWDETIIRQLVDTVKVHSAEKITVFLHGGIQVKQDMI